MTTVTQAEFARLCGVNRSTVSRWLKNGRIDADARGRIDPEAAHRMREATESPLPPHQARKAQFDEARTPLTEQLTVPLTSRPPQISFSVSDEAEEGPAEAAGLRLKRATADLQSHKAALAALELDRQAGVLVERGVVESLIADIGIVTGTVIDGLADRWTAQIAQHRGDVVAVHQALREAADQMRTEIAEHRARRIESLDP